MTIEAILHALFKITKNKAGNHTVSRRTIIDRSFLGGMGAKTLLLFFASLPLIEAALLFNPWVFNYLGIAQAIVFYIVFMSFCMFAVFVMVWLNNKKAKAHIQEAWRTFFPDASFAMLLLADRGPFATFPQVLKQTLDNQAPLESTLKAAFHAMKAEHASMVAFLEQQEKGA